MGGNLECHDVVDVFGALNLVTGQLTARLVERPRAAAKPKKPRSGPRSLQEGCARHLRAIARAYPAAPHRRVVLVSDNAPWPRGALITEVLNEWPQIEL
jgi:hypothetical protein